jgi:acyl-CoA synthetase (AMP-forming)/AMP-acid ligase II
VSSPLFESLERHARERGDCPALRDQGPDRRERVLSWTQLRDAVAACSARLHREPRGVTLVSAPNGAELWVAILGGLRAGERVLPASPELRPAELVDLAERAAVSRVLGGESTRRALAGRVESLLPIEAIELRAPASPRASALPADGSLLLPSSGTIGPPKIARRTLAALEAVGEASRQAIGIGAADRMLVAIPLFHSYGIDQAVLTATMAGCGLHVLRRFDPARVRQVLRRGEASVFPGTPFLFDALARTARERCPLPGLRRALSAGSPLRRRVSERFERAFGVRIGQIYGATEFGSVTYNPPDDDAFDPESVGRPFPGVALRILDPADPAAERPAAPGTEGHVAVSAPSMLAEYVDAPGTPLRDGFFATGDLGRIDAAGRLALTGRLKLIADVGGLKVNPLEVEAALARHPGVREVVVFATAFTDTAQRLKAIVVPEDGARIDAEELRRFAHERLQPYKVPRSFEIRRELPRSATGKLLRGEIANEAARAARGGA